jgi:hypothetical protein
MENFDQGQYCKRNLGRMYIQKETSDATEWNSGIGKRGIKERLPLGCRRTLNKTIRQTVELAIAK